MTGPRDSTGLAVHDWPTAAPARGTLYLLHGYGEHVGRYRRLIGHLNDRGWHVAAHDHRGHGHSPGGRGELPEGSGLVEDAVRLVNAFAERTGGPPVLFGHSMGGMLAAELVLQRGRPVAGLILSSPALRPNLSRIQRAQLRVLHALAPRLVLSRPIDGRRLSHDPGQVEAYHDDPLVHGRISAAMVRWMLESGRESVRRSNELACPTLLIGGSRDEVVDPAGWRAFAQRAAPSKLAYREIEGGLHELFNEAPEWREPALATLDGWLDERFPEGRARAA